MINGRGKKQQHSFAAQICFNFLDFTQKFPVFMTSTRHGFFKEVTCQKVLIFNKRIL